MRKRIEAGIAAIEAAEEEGRKHACIAVPDARITHSVPGEAREKGIRECHALEAAVE